MSRRVVHAGALPSCQGHAGRHYRVSHGPMTRSFRCHRPTRKTARPGNEWHALAGSAAVPVAVCAG